MNNVSDAPDGQGQERVVCPSSHERAVRLFIVAGILIGFGVYCFVDAFVRGKYPHVRLSEDLNGWAEWAFNFFGTFVFTGLGVIPLVIAIASLNHTMIADAEGIGYVGKTKTPWSSVVSLDASQLQKKQILSLECPGGRRIKLDGYKLRNFKELVAFVERRVSPSRPES